MNTVEENRSTFLAAPVILSTHSLLLCNLRDKDFLSFGSVLLFGEQPAATYVLQLDYRRQEPHGMCSVGRSDRTFITTFCLQPFIYNFKPANQAKPQKWWRGELLLTRPREQMDWMGSLHHNQDEIWHFSCLAFSVWRLLEILLHRMGLISFMMQRELQGMCPPRYR